MQRLVSWTLTAVALTAGVYLSTSAWAQTPQPFPRSPAQQAPPPPAPPPQTQVPAAPPARPAVPAQAAGEVPTEATLGVPLYPNAQYLGSFDAGRGQRFYLFGVQSPFVEMVTYYRTTLKQRGEVLFEAPGTHMFEMGRFREEAMAFPPSVTVKDYTWGGSPGLPNPKVGAQPPHFPTVLQIVPAPTR
ncbi:MAG: hypothetical protein ABR606_05715 [Vicinamibacterales bacterium]